MRTQTFVAALGLLLLLGSQVLLLPNDAYASCCPCGGPCPMYNSHGQKICDCCICGAKATVGKYDATKGNGTLQLNTLHGTTESLNFTVPESVRDKLSALKAGESHQFSLRFSGELSKPLKVECFGIDEDLPDRTGSILVTRELMTVLRNTPTHDPDHALDKK